MPLEAEKAPAEPRHIRLREFLAVWRTGDCHAATIVFVAAMHSLGSGLTVALLFAIRSLANIQGGLVHQRSLLIIASVGVLLLFRGLALFVAENLAVRHSVRVFETLRRKVFLHLLRLPLPVLRRQGVGQWIARCTNDIRTIEMGLLSLPRVILSMPLAILMYLGAILAQSVVFGVVVGGWMLIAILPAVLVRQRLLKISSQLIERIGSLTGRLTESLARIKTIKALCAEDREGRYMNEWVDGHIDLVCRAQLISTATRQAFTLIMVACFLVVAFIGRYYVVTGVLGLGELVAILTGIVLLAQEVQRAIAFVPSLQGFSVAVHRYLETLDRPVEPLEPDNPVPLPTTIGDLTFENVCFAYEGGKSLITDLSFSLQRGGFMAVVGLSGAGKSTLIEMILAFRQPTSGRILAGGASIYDYPLAQWRQAVGVVFQHPDLFHGTIKENVVFDRSDITDDHLAQAFRALGLDRLIESRPGGQHALVLEAAANLSEGEVQRLALLRTLFRAPQVLLLDEPTAALDAHSETAVMDLIQSHAAERITLMITHRMSLAFRADTVLVIGPEGVEGLGPPVRLYETCPLFKYMCLAQHVRPDSKARFTAGRTADDP